jgi:putative tryptophan/tyrosine transport system substrate-binding protein
MGLLRTRGAQAGYCRNLDSEHFRPAPGTSRSAGGRLMVRWTDWEGKLVSGMRRRDFITMLGGAAAAWPLEARAQQKEGTPHIGVLLGLADGQPETRSRVKAFQKGLRDLGWVEGQNIRAEYRFAGSDPNRIREYTAELVRLKPDVIVANSTPVLSALRQATSTIPIVFAVVNDPVGQGFVSSAAHPGGNVTGFSFIEPSLVGK